MSSTNASELRMSHLLQVSPDDPALRACATCIALASRSSISVPTHPFSATLVVLSGGLRARWSGAGRPRAVPRCPIPSSTRCARARQHPAASARAQTPEPVLDGLRDPGRSHHVGARDRVFACPRLPHRYADQRVSTPRRPRRPSTSSRPLATCVIAARTLVAHALRACTLAYRASLSCPLPRAAARSPSRSVGVAAPPRDGAVRRLPPSARRWRLRTGPIGRWPVPTRFRWPTRGLGGPWAG